MNNFIETLNPGIHPSLLSALRNTQNRLTDSGEGDRRTLYREAVDRISSRWTAETTQFISGSDNPIRNSLLACTEELDRVWIDCRAGKAGMVEFKEALNIWGDTYEKIVGDSGKGLLI